MTDDEIKLQMARREGYLRGGYAHCELDGTDEIEAEAKEEFPITRTVPNEVTVNGREYRLYAGELQCRYNGWWYTAAYSEEVEAIRQLLANPTKEVNE